MQVTMRKREKREEKKEKNHQHYLRGYSSFLYSIKQFPLVTSFDVDQPSKSASMYAKQFDIPSTTILVLLKALIIERVICRGKFSLRMEKEARIEDPG